MDDETFETTSNCHSDGVRGWERDGVLGGGSGSGVYKLRSVQNTGTCYPSQGWFVRNLGWGR